MRRTPLKPGKPLQRRAGLKTKTGLKAKRDKPRRDEGRIDHGRISGPRNPDPTADQREFWRWLREEKGCVITGARGQGGGWGKHCTIHHITSDGHKRIDRDHWLVLPLRADLHQNVWDSRNSIEAMNHAEFAKRHRIDLIATSRALLDEWRGLRK